MTTIREYTLPENQPCVMRIDRAYFPRTGRVPWPVCVVGEIAGVAGTGAVELPGHAFEPMRSAGVIRGDGHFLLRRHWWSLTLHRAPQQTFRTALVTPCSSSEG